MKNKPALLAAGRRAGRERGSPRSGAPCPQLGAAPRRAAISLHLLHLVCAWPVVRGAAPAVALRGLMSLAFGDPCVPPESWAARS